MGKCRKRSKRSTGYPYRAIPVTSHIHIVRPKVRSDGTAPMFLGLFCDPSGFDISQKIIRRRSSGQLKRLGFVRTYGIYCWARANKLMASVYSNGRSCLPGVLDSSVRNFEHRVTDVTLPIISAMQAKSIGVLAKLDNQVNSAFHYVDKVAHKMGISGHPDQPANTHSSSVDSANTPIEEGGKKVHLLQKITETAEPFLKNPSFDGFTRMMEGEKELLGKLLASSAYPVVTKLWESSVPGMEFTRKKYLECHDSIVASAYYTRTLDIAAGFVNRVQHNSMVQIAYRCLYPYVQNYTEPALENMKQSLFLAAVLDHLRPHAESAPDSPGSGRERGFPMVSCIQC